MECIYSLTITKAVYQNIYFFLANLTNIVNVDDFIYIQLLKPAGTIVNGVYRNITEMEPK